MPSTNDEWSLLSPRWLCEQAPTARRAHQCLEPASFGSRDAPARVRDAVVVPPLVPGVGRGAPGSSVNEAVLDHAGERAVHRSYVGSGCLAPCLDVLDDPVA